ncbi:hypothetical protein AAG747_26835 [Rapidithrix thailandica]|uniref:Uncharacterized protein n=1 Tax=Rapidithrix thailandica TaxID=413964 RepID=A0AAW9SL22_9BACT
MAGRNYSDENYRYGFNGMEGDASTGKDNYTTFFRPYNPSIGRWFLQTPYLTLGKAHIHQWTTILS